jgi:class 3 adenylate cyclase
VGGSALPYWTSEHSTHDGRNPPSYTAAVVDEPVRGGFLDPSFFSLSGADHARSHLRGFTPRFPLGHLVGHWLSQVGSGSVSGTMPASPWLQALDGTVDFRILMEAMLYFAVLTGAPAGSEVHATALTVNNMRPATVESQTLLARARTLNTGPTFTLADAVIEDAQGRGVAHGTATYVIRPIDPPPPPRTGPETLYRRPVYPTPDPWQRPLLWSPRDIMLGEMPPLDILQRIKSGELPNIPLLELLGIRIVEAVEGAAVVALPASEWLGHITRHVAPGAMATFAWVASAAPVATLASPGERHAVLDQTVTFLSPVPTDGREVLARGRLTHRRGDLLLSTAEIIDADGNVVAVGHQTSLLTPRRSRTLPGSEPERVLATVLFTDIVASSQHAERLGDTHWRHLLDEHHALVRKQLDVFKGREVKTTGDGFLATFHSPGRAVQCARAIRDDVRRLGVEIRAGLHTGECEVSGADVAGIAVHIASRVQSLAGPGEVLVSGTVRDLVTGSGLRFADRGRHALKGMEGDWQLFVVED